MEQTKSLVKQFNFGQTELELYSEISNIKSSSKPLKFALKRDLSKYKILIHKHNTIVEHIEDWALKLFPRFVVPFTKTFVPNCKRSKYSFTLHGYKINKSFLAYLTTYKEEVYRLFNIEKVVIANEYLIDNLYNVVPFYYGKRGKKVLCEGVYNNVKIYQPYNVNYPIDTTLKIRHGKLYIDNNLYDVIPSRHLQHRLVRYKVINTNLYKEFVKLLSALFHSVNVSNDDDWDTYLGIEVTKLLLRDANKDLEMLQRPVRKEDYDV